MEGEISKIGHRGKRILMTNSSYENTQPPSPLSGYPGGDAGLDTYSPSELEMMMMTMTSHYHHSNFLKDLYQHQDLYHAVLAYMEKADKEAQALREENISLKMANCQLNNQLAALQKATCHYSAASVGHSGLGLGQGMGYGLNSVLSAMEGMGLAGESEERSFEDNLEDAGPAGSVDLESVEEKENVAPDPDRISLPKSISVRASGFLKTAQSGGSSGVKANKQKVFVPGGEKEDELLELDVYKQGMLKTELCNKWQETGICPYGENCQFAHGMKELRPIIRHPRYKTEVCRMVVSGVHCPYGHRCHFRHALTDEEKLMRSMNVDNGYAKNPGLWSLK